MRIVCDGGDKICTKRSLSDPSESLTQSVSEITGFGAHSIHIHCFDSTCSTMQIKYSDIPKWLENSEFYRNLNNDEEDGDCIDIPAKCFRETSEHVLTSNDLADVLQVMRFWMTSAIPQSVLEFCYANDWSVWNKVFVEIGGEGMAEFEVINFACRHSDQFSLSAALSSERPELVIF